jgi:plasmid stability protein
LEAALSACNDSSAVIAVMPLIAYVEGQGAKTMSTITIRNLDDSVKQVLRERAAARGVSMEQEVRDSLREVAIPKTRLENGTWRLKASREEILALGRKLERPFDLKALTDHMWDEGLL